MKQITWTLLAFVAFIGILTRTEAIGDQSEKFFKCFPNHKLTVSDPQQVSEILVKSRLQFTIEFTKMVLHSSKTGQNFFFSPHSVYQALLLAFFVADGQTEKSIRNALQLPSNIDKLDVLQAFKMDNEFEKLRSLNGSSSYEMSNANKLFYERSLPVRDCMKTVFTDELSALNFKEQSNVAAEIINNWISNVTRHQIEQTLSEGDVHSNSKLILVNAMYFKGLWASKFLPENTKKDVFFTGHKSKLVPMMRQKGNFRYLISEKLGAHVLQLPYKGDDIAMFILLPPFVKPHGTELLLEKLNVQAIAELVEPNAMGERPVELGIPKFTVEQELENFVPILKAMGVGDLFDSTSDLSALTGNQGEIFFNDAKHKAKVSLDEEGTVAAASTAVFTFRSSRPVDPIKFICNHPFIYFIYDNVSQSVLFIGQYNSPV